MDGAMLVLLLYWGCEFQSHSSQNNHGTSETHMVLLPVQLVMRLYDMISITITMMYFELLSFDIYLHVVKYVDNAVLVVSP